MFTLISFYLGAYLQKKPYVYFTIHKEKKDIFVLYFFDIRIYIYTVL